MYFSLRRAKGKVMSESVTDKGVVSTYYAIMSLKRHNLIPNSILIFPSETAKTCLHRRRLLPREAILVCTVLQNRTAGEQMLK